MKKFRLPALFVGVMTVLLLFGCNQANGGGNSSQEWRKDFSDEVLALYDEGMAVLAEELKTDKYSSEDISKAINEINEALKKDGFELIDRTPGKDIEKDTTEEQLKERFYLKKI